MHIFSEDPPLKRKGHGLSVLLYSMFSASAIEISSWYTFLPKKGITAQDIFEAGIPNVTIIGNWKMFSFLRVKGKLNKIVNEIAFFISFRSIVRSFKREPMMPIFIPIGASPLILFKIRMIQRRAPNPVWIYQVDDVDEIASQQNNFFGKWLCRRFLNHALSNSARIFAISDGLAKTLATRSGKSADVILPCFQKENRITKKVHNNVFTFIFTGGLSFLYNDSLKMFAELLQEYGTAAGREFKMIIQTYSPKKQFDQIGLPVIAEYRTAESRDDLVKTYQEGDAFIIPYSFDEKWRKITATSFPQKVAQIIQYGLPIVVFGPSYGSVVDFFRIKKLRYVIDEPSPAKFKEFLQAVIQPDDQWSSDFCEEVYEMNFSPRASLKKLKEAFL